MKSAGLGDGLDVVVRKEGDAKGDLWCLRPDLHGAARALRGKPGRKPAGWGAELISPVPHMLILRRSSCLEVEM